MYNTSDGTSILPFSHGWTYHVLTCAQLNRYDNDQLGGHMQSFMFATWCPPRERGAVSRLVSREDRVASSFDGGVFRMDW